MKMKFSISFLCFHMNILIIYFSNLPHAFLIEGSALSVSLSRSLPLSPSFLCPAHP